jgi:hypothetical protein
MAASSLQLRQNQRVWLEGDNACACLPQCLGLLASVGTNVEAQRTPWYQQSVQLNVGTKRTPSAGMSSPEEPSRGTVEPGSDRQLLCRRH